MIQVGPDKGGRIEIARPHSRSTSVMETKQRTCLKCNRLFNSAGPANRICRHCQQINARLPQFTEAQMQQQRGTKRHNGEIIEPVLGK